MGASGPGGGGCLPKCMLGYPSVNRITENITLRRGGQQRKNSPEVNFKLKLLL